MSKQIRPRHTKESKWIAVGYVIENTDDNEPDICSCDPAAMGQDHFGKKYLQVAESNARRIVACVSALEGVSTEEIEGSDFISGLIEQRDELLTICEELQEAAEYWSEYFVPLGIVERLDAAIAKVKGGA